MIDFKEIMKEIPQPLWGNWYITDKIDSGAFSEVYRIEAKREGRTDVSTLKIVYIVLDDEIVCDDEQKKMLLEQKYREAVNETSIMYKLKNCPYIVSYEDENIFPLTCTPGCVMLIRMEYIMELPALIEKGGFPPTEENILRLAANIGRGLNASHKLGIYHRDIKPSNFFAAPDGTFKLGDFNISGSKESARTISGTAGYIAPEIYKAINSGTSEYTNRADIYSFGICLYQLMNDFFFPFEEECPTEQAVERRMNGEPLPAPKKASPDFGRMILRACAFDPALRYGSMDEMLCDIENLRARRSVAVISPASVTPENHTGYMPAAGMSVPAMPQAVPAGGKFIRPDHADPQIIRPQSKLLPVLILILIVLVIILIIVTLMPDKNNKNKDKNKDTGNEKVSISSTEKTGYGLGDVNGDGVLTGTDATLVLEYYTQLSAAWGRDFPSLEEWLSDNK